MSFSPEDWEQIKEAFERLVPLDAGARAEQLRQMPSSIAGPVSGLLANHDAAEGFMESPLIRPSDLLASVDREAWTFSPGDVLLDRFEILHCIGRGGMGEVYEAFDRDVEERIAIKTVRRSLAGDEPTVERFRKEVQRSRRVTHANVCRIYDLFAVPSGSKAVPLFTMELLEGPTLAAYLEKTGRLAPSEALPIALDLCQGLAAAHAAQVVHRDFKSGNVMLVRSPSGCRRAVITDFGLAGNTTPGTATTTVWRDRGLVGTPPYIAPELLEGHTATWRSDIYALGVVLHEMVTGKHPFQAATPDLALRMRLYTPPPSPRVLVPDLPRGWEQAILMCLDRQADLRPQDASIVRGALTGTVVAAGRPSKRWKLTGHPSRRTFAGAAGVAAVAVAAFQFRRLAPGMFPAVSRPFVVIADFDEPADGAAVGETFRTLLAVSLEQSRYIRVLSIAEARATAARISAKTAERIARLHGATAVISGGIRSQEDGHVLYVQIIRLDGGARIAREERIAASADLAKGVDRLAEKVRLSLGEAERSVHEDRVSLEQATSANLDALRLFSDAVTAFNLGDPETALVRLEQATRDDPEFAMAYLYQALVHSAMRRDEQGLPPALHALKLANRLSACQRAHIQAVYYVLVGDYERAMKTFSELVALYPHEAQLRRALAHQLGIAGRPDAAVEQANEAVSLEPSNVNSLSVLAVALTEANRPDGALQIVSDARRKGLEKPLLGFGEGLGWLYKSDYSKADAAFERYASIPELESTGRAYRTRCLILSGQLNRACEDLEADLRVDLEKGDRPSEVLRRYWLAQLYVVLDQRTPALQHARALVSVPAIPASLFALRSAALCAFDLGDGETLRTASEKLTAIRDAYRGTRSVSFVSQAGGLIARLAGDPVSAGRLLKESLAMWRDIPNAWTLAEHQRHIGLAPEAAANYEAIIVAKGVALRWEYATLWVMAHGMAGVCQKSAGDVAFSRRRLDEFLYYWGSQVSSSSLVRRIQTAKSELVRQQA